MSGRDRSGRFVTFEGGEGAGKSTQVGRLAERLRGRGLEVVTTREPGGSPHAEALRGHLLSGKAKLFGPAGEALLFAAARIDHIDATIAPALARGAWVICDRFADSTRAYQGAAGNLDPDLLASLERVTLAGTKPDLTLVLDLPVRLGLRRASERRASGAADRFEAEGLEFHKTLRNAFLSIAEGEPERVAVIDAARSPDAVEAAVWNIVVARLADAIDAGKASA